MCTFYRGGHRAVVLPWYQHHVNREWDRSYPGITTVTPLIVRMPFCRKKQGAEFIKELFF
jgi:hypothetical protein